mgnify:CR=1 FL=1
MNLSNPLLLLIFCLFYFGITFILMSYLVSRRIKKNPLVLPQNDTPYGIVGKYFKLVIILLFTYVVMINITPSISIYYPDFSLMKSNTMVFIGFSVMFISLTLTIVSQITMSNSWRIGIDLDKILHVPITDIEQLKFDINLAYFCSVNDLKGTFVN